MPLDLLMALAGYVTAMSVTPGPNNLMLLTSGVNFGFRRTIPHMAGIALGVLTILALVGLGLGHLLVSNPRLYTALKIASLIYLAWLAWKIATSGPPVAGETNAKAQPLTALEAALFQWVNPKAWAMVVTAATAFTVPDNYVPEPARHGLRVHCGQPAERRRMDHRRHHGASEFWRSPAGCGPSM